MAVGLGTVLAVGPSALGVRVAVAAFVDNSVGASSQFGAAPDWVAPEVGSTTIAKISGYMAGSIKQAGSYYVYANVTDSGSPASGLALTAENANVSAITPGGTAIPLIAGAYSVGGVAYNHRSASLVAGTLAAGSYQYAIASTDVAGNTRAQSGYTVTVDNTAPAASNVQTTNAGTAGRAGPGDTIVYTFSEQIDPHSILAGWTGSSTNVVVRLIDGGCTLILCSDDSVRIHNAANSAVLPLGTIDLNRDDYHGGGILGSQPDLTFGAGGTPSTMVQSGATITVTLGTGSATATTAGGNGTMTWAASATAYDAAGNIASTGAISEGGAGDREF